MNERIKQLVGQAKCMAEETINKQISKNAELDAFAEKFAELIVKECVEQIYPEWLKKGETRVETPLGFAVKRVKEHFGVE